MTDVNLRALVLNEQYLPAAIFPEISTISVKDAIRQYLNDACDVIHFYERPVLSGFKQMVDAEKGPLFWPSVIVHKKSGRNKKLRLTKHNLYLRDHQVCFWCDKPLTFAEATKDHVIPRTLGGSHSFDNVVCACTDCNSEKGDSPPTGKWKPKKEVYEPTFYDLLEIRKKFPVHIDDESWKMFLPEWSSDVIVRKQREPKLKLVVDNTKKVA